ncbi:hypothetical protein HRR80_007834 [Exophiala dermatitidis]|uniref:Uncharacterized protein n=1 Tax=Exophiala dermatitidis TaxID=5970 RepID=A0AAN6EMG1_EXODE|nr:hypothetical protein HRR80_007834 [Exophiala dermatitidis]
MLALFIQLHLRQVAMPGWRADGRPIAGGARRATTGRSVSGSSINKGRGSKGAVKLKAALPAPSGILAKASIDPALPPPWTSAPRLCPLKATLHILHLLLCLCFEEPPPALCCPHC